MEISSTLIESEALLWLELFSVSIGFVGGIFAVGGALNMGGAFNTVVGVSDTFWSVLLGFKPSSVCATLLFSWVRLVCEFEESSAECRNSGGSFQPFSLLPIYLSLIKQAVRNFLFIIKNPLSTWSNWILSHFYD